ncbi:hypothetical protein BEWA_046900 [Theileria equi strain WA]|uniref:Uncharacterized protein n=1 Tax=Theileria equi strain WA TaxID=1537102 RepID=L1L9Q1_THEEQ|nr:hypothetical protein BEWA_046900 [Theileria equi strain WA]EKX72226.1 hypothetical protein BEWA_046900 [Theileria equi strain WA]|eukprot:XP_004831678.1 hypothetical protein BEWA_046900 [Theileria equi strain WA]
MTALPAVTIDIQRSPSNGKESDTYTSGGGSVSLNKIEDPPESGFLKFIHTSPDGSPFKVSEVRYGATPASDLNPSDDIQHLSVWYWKDTAVDMTNPLLIEILQGDNRYTYKSAKAGGTSWQPLPIRQSPRPNPLTGKTLETQLDGLNCSLNQAVTFNLTFELSSSLSDKHKKSRDDNTYCCSTHCPQGTSGRVTVKLNKVSCKQNHRSADYYRHKINTVNGRKVAAIKYDPTGGSTRNRINLNGHKSPPSVTTVYAFYSGQNPKLIYVYGGTATGWYKKPITISNGDTDEVWTPVKDLNGITPDYLTENTECSSWTAVKKALTNVTCSGCPPCPLPQSPPPPLAPSSNIDSGASGAVVGPIVGLLGTLLGALSGASKVVNTELLENLVGSILYGSDLAATIGIEALGAALETTLSYPISAPNPGQAPLDPPRSDGQAEPSTLLLPTSMAGYFFVGSAGSGHIIESISVEKEASLRSDVCSTEATSRFEDLPIHDENIPSPINFMNWINRYGFDDLSIKMNIYTLVNRR